MCCESWSYMARKWISRIHVIALNKSHHSLLFDKWNIYLSRKYSIWKNISGFMVLLHQILKYVLDRNFSTSNSAL